MRGDDRQQGAMYSYISPEARVPHDHPLRAIRGLVDDVLRELSPRFEGLYARVGRPSIAPEQLLRAQLLQILYTIRSERQLMEQLDYNLLFRWFVGLNMDEPVWDPTVFTKNRQRLLDGEVATAFLERVVALAQQRRLLSGEQASARDPGRSVGLCSASGRGEGRSRRRFRQAALALVMRVLALDHLALHVRPKQDAKKAAIRARHEHVITFLQTCAEIVQGQMRPDGDGAGLHDPLGGGGRPPAQRAGIDEAQQDLLIVQYRAEVPTARFHASRDVTQRFM